MSRRRRRELAGSGDIDHAVGLAVHDERRHVQASRIAQDALSGFRESKVEPRADQVVLQDVGFAQPSNFGT